MQPYLFPYIGYFQLINYVDKFVIHDDVQFIKGGWINRNRILFGSKDYLFTFSLKKDSSYELIKNREFSNSILNEKSKFLRIIDSAYCKAPYFSNVREFIGDSIANDISNMSKAVTLTIKAVCNYLDINTEIVFSSDLVKDETLKSESRVINICKITNASNYINPIGGVALYSKENFNKAGIELNFIKAKKIVYPQFTNSFVSDLSIIDVLMFNSKEKVKLLLEEYELV